MESPLRRLIRRYRILKLLSPILFLVGWELLVRLGQINPLFLPSPLSVLQTTVQMIMDGRLVRAVLVSLNRVGQGFVYGSLIGVVVGMFVGWSRIVEDCVDPIVAAIYPIPKSALFPLFLLWFGLGNSSKVATITVGVLFLVLINTVTGVKSLNPLLIKAAKDLGATSAQIFTKVVLPGSLANIFTGLRLGAGTALILVFVTELEATNSGLGFLMWESYQLMLIQELFACLITFGILGVLSTVLLQWLERWVCPWQI